MGQVIHRGGAARDPSIHNLFQIADVNSGVISIPTGDMELVQLSDSDASED